MKINFLLFLALLIPPSSYATKPEEDYHLILYTSLSKREMQTYFDEEKVKEKLSLEYINISEDNLNHVIIDLTATRLAVDDLIQQLQNEFGLDVKITKVSSVDAKFSSQDEGRTK